MMAAGRRTDGGYDRGLLTNGFEAARTSEIPLEPPSDVIYRDGAERSEIILADGFNGAATLPPGTDPRAPRNGRSTAIPLATSTEQPLDFGFKDFWYLLGLLFTDYEKFSWTIDWFFPETKFGESQQRFADTSQAVSSGGINRERGVITGQNLNIPIGERQTAVLNAIDKATNGNENEARLLQSFWGAESVFGTKLKSPTTAQGDFHFTQGTWADTINRRGAQMISEMREDGYIEKADILQSYIDNKKVGSSATTHSDFLALRNDPVLATYAAKHLIDMKSDAIGADPKNPEDWGKIYMAYSAGEAVVMAFKHIQEKYPNANFHEALRNLTPENSGLSEQTIKAIKHGVENNPGMFPEDATAEGVLNHYNGRVEKWSANAASTLPTPPNGMG
jgi:hypothetical protein